MDNHHAFNTHQLKQLELVNFLYDRFQVGMLITLMVGFVSTALAAYELSIQGRDAYVYLWFIGLLGIQGLRLLSKQMYDRDREGEFIDYRAWKRRFILGVYLAALWQGIGAVLVMPHVSVNLQIIFLAFLLGMGAGAIAYLATSMIIFVSYLVLMILPIALYLFWLGRPDSMVLGAMLVFMIVAYYFGVRRMNRMITEALHLRFDNELLVNDLQRLLAVVARSNKELDRLSTTDELTGAQNFRAFRVRLEEQRRKHLASHLPLSVVLINVDYYFEYNAEYGQAQGDATLKAIADVLMQELLRKDVIIARISGAEFGVLMPNVSCENARALTEKVMNAIQARKIEHLKSEISDYLTISAGISCVPVNERMNDRDLLTRAEEALRVAKNNGRNRIEVINF
jgi:diguanylate cyclase (GGDEF)-like protein